MTQRELMKKMRDAGWYFVEGAGHTMAKHIDRPGQKIPIPLHKGDIPKGTADSILKAAGLK